MTEPDDLAESLQHLEYEMAMIVAAWRMVSPHPLQEPTLTGRPATTGPTTKPWPTSQGWNPHSPTARLLDDFFAAPSQLQPVSHSGALSAHYPAWCKGKPVTP